MAGSGCDCQKFVARNSQSKWTLNKGQTRSLRRIKRLTVEVSTKQENVICREEG